MPATIRGIAVRCTVCGKVKAPRGRSVSPLYCEHLCIGLSFFTEDCPGYQQAPFPGDLWPGETDEDFGYPCSTNATEPVEETKHA